MPNFAKSLKRYLGSNFTRIENEKIRKGRGPGVSEKYPTKLITRRFKSLLKMYEIKGGKLSTTQEEALYTSGLLLRPEELEIEAYADLNNTGMLADSLNQQKIFKEAMQEKYAKHLKNSIAIWLIYFSLLCRPLVLKKDSTNNALLHKYFIILKVILKRNYNWGIREKNERAEYPAFHPEITPKVIEMTSEIISQHEKGSLEEVKNKYGTVATNLIRSNNLAGLINYLTEVLFYEKFNLKHKLPENGEYTWVKFATAKEGPDLSILTSQIPNICLGGASTSTNEYLSFSKVYVFGDVGEISDFKDRPIKKLIPRAICVTNNDDKTIREFRGTMEFQELAGKTVAKLQEVNTPVPALQEYLQAHSRAVINSIRLGNILEKIRIAKSKKTSLSLEAGDFEFIQRLDPRAPTIGTRSVSYIKTEIANLLKSN